MSMTGEKLPRDLRELTSNVVKPNSPRHKFLLRVRDGWRVNIARYRHHLRWALAQGWVQKATLSGPRHVLTDHGRREMRGRGLFDDGGGDDQ